MVNRAKTPYRPKLPTLVAVRPLLVLLNFVVDRSKACTVCSLYLSFAYVTADLFYFCVFVTDLFYFYFSVIDPLCFFVSVDADPLQICTLVADMLYSSHC